MNIDVRHELSQLAQARQQLLEVVALASREPGDAARQLRSWRERWHGLAHVRGELGGVVAASSTLEHVLDWGASVRSADADMARHLVAAKADASVLLGDGIADDPYGRALHAFASAVRDCTNYEDLQAVVDLFGLIPVRTSITKKKATEESRRGPADRDEPEPVPPVIDLDVTIDDDPWVGPRLLLLNHAHKVTITAALSHRPADLQSVTITVIGTLGPDVLAWPEIRFNAADFTPTATRVFSVVGRATTDFRSGHELRLSARLHVGDEERALTAIGLRTLQPVITDRAAPTMGTGTVPLQLWDVLHEIGERGLRPDREHWSDFEQLLRATLEFQLSMLAGGDYRDTEDRLERDFQVDVRRFLHARLGADDVHEGEATGGGKFDLRYRTVPDELKVERDTADLDAIAKKYSAQASQYPAAVGRQLAVLTVLEVTKKDEHLANVANYVRVIDRVPAAAAGLHKPLPLITVLVVIPANYPRPSDLTR